MAEDIITEKRGRFFCAKDGKLLVNVNAADNKIICVVGNKRYNAFNGRLIQRQTEEVTTPDKVSSARKAGDSQQSSTANRSRRRGGEKKTTIINNYYSEDDELPKKKIEKKKKEVPPSYPIIPKKIERTFTGFFIGTFYGYFGNSIDQQTKLSVTDDFTGSTALKSTTSLSTQFGNHGFGFLAGFNFQPHKNIMLGLEGGGYVIADSSIRIPAGAVGNYLSRIRDLAFAHGRIGFVVANMFNLYVGGGFGVSNFYEKNLHPSEVSGAGIWSDLEYVKVYPQVIAGFEWLAIGHVSIRLQYELSIFLNTRAIFIDIIQKNNYETLFEYNGLRHEFKFILSYKF